MDPNNPMSSIPASGLQNHTHIASNNGSMSQQTIQMSAGPYVSQNPQQSVHLHVYQQPQMTIASHSAIHATNGAVYAPNISAPGTSEGPFQSQAEQYRHATQPHAQAQVVNPARPRKLQVDDALSYLEQVRQQFADNPDVYNHFLEVMKEFKSHTIDTQGVITRVSRLFSGNPNLITGFNTFLPPGYEVRVSTQGILIIEPNGRNMLVDAFSGEPIPIGNAQVGLPALPQDIPNAIPPQAQHAMTLKSEIEAPNTANEPAVSGAQVGYAASGSLFCNESMQAFPATQDVKPPTTFSSKPAESGAATSAPMPTAAQQPLHFDQAVGYLNRIKERFTQRPEIYREFLNILNTYQRTISEPDAQSGRLPMKEAEVCRAVSQLFRDEEDLMRDFKSFLPDATPMDTYPTSQQQATSAAIAQAEKSQTAAADSTSKVKPSLAPSTGGKKKEPGIAGDSATKKPKVVTKVGYEMSVPECLEDIPLKDFVFFEKIHKALKNESVVKNFFRCLLLYNKSLVSRVELVEMANPFLSEHPDLLKQFHEILGIGSMVRSPGKLEKVENRLTSELASQIDYSTCKRLGVSYRSLPDSYERSKCSGRTKLCDSVLNDTWVSFPSWSSEDTSSVSSKKSQFEDFMYRTEDERFEVDILIEVNSAAITALESVRKKIENMRTEEAQAYIAESNYGCVSPTLMARAVKKLYGEHATKILEGLRENPMVAVPKVVQRLKEKDAEWRSIREEFNVIWRDQIDKNYLKSLDHQATSFKANDLKFLRSKSIIQQLETIFDERQQRMDNGGPVENGPHMIMEYPEDISVIHDANELLIHYVKRQQNIPKREKFMIKRHLRCLIPRLFNLDLEVMSDDDEENDSDKSDTEGPILTRRTKRLLRGKRNATKCTELSSNKQALSDVGYTLFFAPNCWLIFMRLHHIICERLACLKKRAEELVQEYEFEKQIRERQEAIFQSQGRSMAAQQGNAVDVHLGLRELKKPLQNPETFYPTLMQELKNVLDGIIDGSNFEDNIRNMFGTSAYIMFTMDKLIATITRQLQSFVSDEASVNAVSLFHKYCAHRAQAGVDQKHGLQVDESYEMASEKVITNQNCFKMFFLYLANPTVTVELIDTDTDLDESGEENNKSVSLFKWKEYVEKYAGDDENTNETIIPSNLFLVRNVLPRKLKTEAAFDYFTSPPPDPMDFFVNEGLRAVLSSENVKFLYEQGTSDIIIRKGAPGAAKKAQASTTERRSRRFREWVRKKYDKELEAQIQD